MSIQYGWPSRLFHPIPLHMIGMYTDYQEVFIVDDYGDLVPLSYGTQLFKQEH